MNKVLSIFDVDQKANPYILILISGLIIHFKQLFLGQITGWDTFDITTVNFIYFTDSIKSGFIPKWNPFIMSGVPFFGSIVFSAAIFSPIYLLSALMTYLVSPVYMIELLLFFASILGGIGIYKFLCSTNHSKSVSLIFSILFMTTVYTPIWGQIYFIFSLTSFPWLLNIVHKVFDENSKHLNLIVSSILISFIYANGYFYYNFIISLFSLLYFIFLYFEKPNKKVAFNFLLSMFIIHTLYILLNLEGVINFSSIFENLNGDYVTGEPRMRLISNPVKYYLDNIYTALLALVSNIFPKVGWTYGIGLSILLLPILFMKSIFKILKNKYFYFLIILISFGIILSFRNRFSEVISIKVPLFNSYRWYFSNIHFSIIGLVLLIAYLYNKTNIKKIWAILFVASSLIYNLFQNNQLLNSNKYTENIPNRKIDVTISQNIRELSESKFYDYSNINWLISKTPFSHGYFNTTNPIYWEIKNFSFLKSIYTFTTNTLRYPTLTRKDFKSDNLYVNYLVTELKNISNSSYFLYDANSDFDNPKLNKSLYADEFKQIEFKQTPNSLEVLIENKKYGHFIFFNNWSKNWSASVNNIPAKINKVNYLFQSVELNPGINKISFVYKSDLYLILLVYYLIVSVVLSYFFVYKSILRKYN